MSRRNRNIPFVISIASGLGIAWLVHQRRRELNSLTTLQHVLIKYHGMEKAQQLADIIRQRWADLVAETPMPENQSLRKHLKENILAGLAMYQVLLQEYDGDQQAALAEVEEVIRAQVLGQNRLLLAPLKILPAPFQVFRLGFKVQMEAFPPEGWKFEHIENSEDRIAFNATRCFYLNTLTALGAPELTASFCKSDDVMAELFPPSICFIRRQTLGRGDPVCDFQYLRVEKP